MGFKGGKRCGQRSISYRNGNGNGNGNGNIQTGKGRKPDIQAKKKPAEQVLPVRSLGLSLT
ncbi:hypothetical protein AW734_04785 [Pantoea ananatis]|nr:hypothetical protein AW734_04785 [Pantoea ananatis]